MAQAQFLVVRHPGAQVPGLGYVRAGQTFFAPDFVVNPRTQERKPYEPSRFMRALNQEAVELLKKLKADLEVYDKHRVAALDGVKDADGRKVVAPVLAKDVNLELYVAPVETPVVQESGLSDDALVEMARAAEGLDASTPKKAVLPEQRPLPGKQGRLADQR
jgi:hypothetical protein